MGAAHCRYSAYSTARHQFPCCTEGPRNVGMLFVISHVLVNGSSVMALQNTKVYNKLKFDSLLGTDSRTLCRCLYISDMFDMLSA